MNIPAEFDEIRPYAPEELPQVFEELIADPMFKAVVENVMPGIPFDMIAAQMRQCKTNLDFQKAFFYRLLKDLVQKCAKGLDFDCSALQDKSKNYTFISNHRDIVLDSAILDLMLHEHHFPTTCEIAIGDNLLIYPWIKTLVKLNKAFTVKRGLSPRELMESSQRMSRYMHYAIQEKRENIWIAQREGRAKDSSDHTQESLLKMFAMAGEGSVIDRLKELCLVPLSISYEYDPCDYLKAQEFQQKRDNPSFKKSKQDDLDNMKIGIFGKKGRIHYEAMPCINTWLDELSELPKTEIFSEIARRIDQQIHAGYSLFPGNYVAADMLNGTSTYARHYTEKERKVFETYLQSRIDLVEIANKDENFLRERILTMYANPVFNKQNALR